MSTINYKRNYNKNVLESISKIIDTVKYTVSQNIKIIGFYSSKSITNKIEVKENTSRVLLLRQIFAIILKAIVTIEKDVRIVVSISQ